MNRSLAIVFAAASMTRPAHACAVQQSGTVQTIVDNWVTAHAGYAYGFCVVALDGRNNEGFACSGKADATHGLDKNSLFMIGSVTKTFTGALLAMHIAEGVWALRDFFDDHLPAQYRSGSFYDRATVLQFATHHSGLRERPPHQEGEDGDFAQFKACVDAGTCMNNIGYHYSDWGYQLLGYAMAAEDDWSYYDELWNWVLSGLAMTSTKPYEEWMASNATFFNAHATTRHDSAGNVVGIPLPSLCPTADPSGCLFSSSHDMRIWLQYAMNLRSPNPTYSQALVQLRQFYPQGDPPENTQMGIGWGFSNQDDGEACDVLPAPYTRPDGTIQTHYTRVDKDGAITGADSVIYYLQDPNHPNAVSPKGVVLMTDGTPTEDVKIAARDLLESLPPALP